MSCLLQASFSRPVAVREGLREKMTCDRKRKEVREEGVQILGVEASGVWCVHMATPLSVLFPRPGESLSSYHA